MIEWIKTSSGREALLGTLAFLLGWGWFSSAKEHAKGAPSVGCGERIQVVQQHDVQTVEHTNTITKLTTTVQKADGTKVVQEKIVQQTTKVNSTTADKTNVVVKQAPAQQDKPGYSLGVNYLPAISRKPAPTDLEVEVGARIGQSNWWVTGKVDVKYRQVGIGVRWDF